MNDNDRIQEENEKPKSADVIDDSEVISKLTASIESQIDQMDFSEFDDEDENWTLFKKKREVSGKNEKTEIPEEAENVQPEEPEAGSVEKEKRAETEEAEDEDADLDDAEYLQSAAYRRRARYTLTYEQREKRRVQRITAFWDFVDRNLKQIRWVLTGVLVVAAAVIAAAVSNRWTYHSVSELIVSSKEDTLSVSYANINGKVLKYGVDSAMLVDHNNTMLWSVSYSMSDPEVAVCGDTFAIYDSKGTNICVCSSDGLLGKISADMPIVKAKVSKQGVVAAILEDGQNAWIKSYALDGSEVATLKTTFTNPGYPMDLGLSEDASLLAVSYLYLDNGTPVSRVSFYNFGTVGQNQRDNLVAESEYRDSILPEVDYIDGKNCVVFREDGFSVYTGGQIPSESVRIDADENIVSTFHDAQHVGFILQNRNSENDYTICVYNTKGKEILRRETDFRYENAELNGSQIVLSSRDEFCVYNLQGVEKYRGALEQSAKEFTGFGNNKFIYVSEDLFRIIQIS